MGDHIVRRETPTSPPQPSERRPTDEIPEQQLHQLIHNPTHDDLESELELIDAHPMVFPDSTPESLPTMSQPRLAHTLRRDLRSGPVPVVPSLPPLPSRTGISTLAMSRAQRPTPSVITMPRAEDPTESELPSTERPTLPAIPRFAGPVLAAARAEPRPGMARPAPSLDIAPSEPPLVAAAPRGSLLRKAGQTHLIVRVTVPLLALGTLAFLLLR
jgi:hypothetical protein